MTTSRPSASSCSQGAISAAGTLRLAKARAVWTPAVTATIHGRWRSEGARKAATAASSGTMTRKTTISLPQPRQPLCVERREFALNVVEHDAHDEDADQEIEQDTHLHDHGLVEKQTEDVDPILEHQISGDLGDGLAPGDQSEKAGENRGQRRRHEEAAAMGCCQRKLVREQQRQAGADGT